jgi:hypothetical protein
MMGQAGTFWRALAILSACLALHVTPCAAASPDPPKAVLPVQAWEFTDLEKGRHVIEWNALQTGGVLVFFFDTQSPDSLLGLNYCEALHARARDFGLTVIGVEATGRRTEEVRAALQGFASTYRMPSFPVVADPQSAAGKLFGSGGSPTLVLLGKGGEIIARHAGFNPGVAVEVTRQVERLLLRSEGFFSSALRGIGLSEARERQLGEREAKTEAADPGELKPLAWGDRLPTFDFVDAAGQAGRWAWPSGSVIRVAFFWGGAAGAMEDLVFLQQLREQGDGKYLEILAVESTGLDAGAVAGLLKAVRGRGTALAFPVVPDPQRLLVGLFGAGPPLPRIFLLDGMGQVLYRADGFDGEVRQVLPEKIRRAARLAGLGLPQVPDEVPRRSAAGAESGEAPSIARRLERDKDLRLNLSRGDYFFSNGHHRQALPHYERYLELEPGSLHALVRLAQCHDQLRELPEARRYWERVVNISPAHAEARARLAELDKAGVR